MTTIWWVSIDETLATVVIPDKEPNRTCECLPTSTETTALASKTAKVSTQVGV